MNAEFLPETVRNAAGKEKISIRNLNFYYDQSKALKNINLPLYDRAVTAFIGPSGCGKSTLLRIINRIYELYPKQRAEGEVLLDGENILTSKESADSLRSRVGMVFRSRRRSRCRSTRTSPSASASTRSCRAASSTAGSRAPLSAPRCGRK